MSDTLPMDKDWYPRQFIEVKEGKKFQRYEGRTDQVQPKPSFHPSPKDVQLSVNEEDSKVEEVNEFRDLEVQMALLRRKTHRPVCLLNDL